MLKITKVSNSRVYPAIVEDSEREELDLGSSGVTRGGSNPLSRILFDFFSEVTFGKA